MPSIPSTALPHLARVVEYDRDESAPLSFEGEPEPVEAEDAGAAGERLGPWFPARRMTPRPTEREADAGGGGRRRDEVRWILLYGDEDDDGAELTRPPRASDLVDVKRDGVTTRYTVGPRPRPLDTGEDIIGGQVELLEVADST